MKLILSFAFFGALLSSFSAVADPMPAKYRIKVEATGETIPWDGKADFTYDNSPKAPATHLFVAAFSPGKSNLLGFKLIRTTTKSLSIAPPADANCGESPCPRIDISVPWQMTSSGACAPAYGEICMVKFCDEVAFTISHEHKNVKVKSYE